MSEPLNWCARTWQLFTGLFEIDPWKKQVLILRLLATNGKMEGTELVECAGGKLRRGTVYVYLERLEEAGLISSGCIAEEPPPGGLRRREYWITGAGRTALAQAIVP